MPLVVLASQPAASACCSSKTRRSSMLALTFRQQQLLQQPSLVRCCCVAIIFTHKNGLAGPLTMWLLLPDLAADIAHAVPCVGVLLMLCITMA